jgi:uncharacterized protein (DUF1800 family)
MSIKLRPILVVSLRAIAVLLMLGMASTASAAGALSNLIVTGLSPAFDPNVTNYTVPLPANCSVTVTATLVTPTNQLYIQSNATTSGTPRNTYVCGGKKIDIIVYQNWKEVGRYLITPVAAPPAPPPPPPPALASLTIAGLSPMFAPGTTAYQIQRTAACAVPVTATLADPANRLYIANTETASGVTRQAWVCDGKTKIDVVIFKVWTEVGRYTINVVGDAPPVTPPGDGMGGGSGGGGGTYTPPPTSATEATPTPSPAPVYTKPAPPIAATDAATARRLLHQASFGPTSTEMAAVQATGVNYWLWQQFQKSPSIIPDGLDINALRSQVFYNMAAGDDQLRQRVAFSLSQLFVVSANKNVNGDEIIPYMRMLYTHAFGNYRTLMREVTLSPTMGKYLDLANSVGVGASSAPNENFPREVMQLFTLGIYKLNQDGTWQADAQGQPIPLYQQNTVREMARALSGWTYPSVPGAPYRTRNNENFVGLMEPRPESHDKGSKSIFGTTIAANQSVTKDLDDVLDILFNHPNLPPFVATRLIRALVTSNPTTAYIKRVADVFANNGQGVRGDMVAVVTAVLTDADAALPGATDGHLQDPILNVIGLGRALDATFGDAGSFMYVLGNLGQRVLTPNSVFSFYSPLAPLPHDPLLFGPEFMVYSPSHAIQRANFVYGLLNNQFGSGIQFTLAPYIALAGNPSALVDLVNTKLFQGQMSQPLYALLVSTTQSTSDMTQRAVGALYLAAISSEYLVHAR